MLVLICGDAPADLDFEFCTVKTLITESRHQSLRAPQRHPDLRPRPVFGSGQLHPHFDYLRDGGIVTDDVAIAHENAIRTRAWPSNSPIGHRALTFIRHWKPTIQYHEIVSAERDDTARHCFVTQIERILGCCSAPRVPRWKEERPAAVLDKAY